MPDALMAAAIAMYRSLANLPCRCESVWRGERRHVTKPCARCASMQQWRDATGTDGAGDAGLAVFEAVDRKPQPETL